MPTDQSPGLPRRRFAAFLSYSHSNNRLRGRLWATWLQRELESFAVPRDLVGTQNLRGEPIPERLYPIFRDLDELSAAASLSSEIEGALEQSHFLIVLWLAGGGRLEVRER